MLLEGMAPLQCSSLILGRGWSCAFGAPAPRRNAPPKTLSKGLPKSAPKPQRRTSSLGRRCSWNRRGSHRQRVSCLYMFGTALWNHLVAICVVYEPPSFGTRSAQPCTFIVFFPCPARGCVACVPCDKERKPRAQRRKRVKKIKSTRAWNLESNNYESCRVEPE